MATRSFRIMAGHSKWANIRHRKGRQDAKRGKMWSKCSRAIMAAARHGGGDPDMNLTLRYAIDDARAVNMPKDTIEKAVKKGVGELDGGVEYAHSRFEGYGPGGVAIIVDCLTDNQMRTTPEVRFVFDRHNGKLGVNGSVSFGFAQRGLILVNGRDVSEEKIFEDAVEAGADDVKNADGDWELLTDMAQLHAVKTALVDAGYTIESAQISMIPNTTVACDSSTAQKVLKLLDALEDLEDVQQVYSNADISHEDLEQFTD